MRAASFVAANSARRRRSWSLSRLLRIAAVFATPFMLLLIKLRMENLDGSAAADAHALLIRFSVVGLFAALMAHGYICWTQRPGAVRRP